MLRFSRLNPNRWQIGGAALSGFENQMSLHNLSVALRPNPLVLLASLWLCTMQSLAATVTVPAPVAASASVVDEQPDYKLGPGDVLQVFVWRNPELSVTLPVRADGKISTPLVDDTVAIGKTPSELARDMEATLSVYVLNPKVNIIVTQAISAANQIKVIGQVRSPQSLAYHAGMTALDAIIAVGGLTDFAAGNRARILRKAPAGKEQSIPLRVQDLIKGKLAGNVVLRPGDVLVVPESLF